MDTSPEGYNQVYNLFSFFNDAFAFLIFVRSAIPLPCKESFGMENGVIKHSQFSASADLPDYGLPYARLNGPKAWLGENQNFPQWFQVSFWKPTLITGVSMQGRQDANEWVTRYIVMTKMDNTDWKSVKDEAGKVEVVFYTEMKSKLMLRCSSYCSFPFLPTN